MIYTRQAAKRDGYTHEGRAYGIPVWVKFQQSEIAVGRDEVVEIASKFGPFDVLMPVIDRLYMGWNRMMHPQYGIAFPLLVKEQPI